MDLLEYEQYTCVIRNGQLSADALYRIIKHDKSSEWEDTPGGLARIAVAKDIASGILIPKKLLDEEGDYLYGNKWPLPLTFEKRSN